ncbi:MAG: LacI family DNA-binding transcriptional regulator, partial [Pseudomonadota bacterium]
MKHKSDQSYKADIIAVAKAAKVSPATVSRSFNHPEMVRPQTLKRIEAAVARLGYIRNRAARAMHGRRSGTLGLIVPTMTNSIFSEVTQAFSDAADLAGFTILVATHGYDLSREVSLLRKFLEHRVDGVALIGLDHEEATYTLIDQQNVPVVAIWNFDAASRVPCVGVDNAGAGRLAAEHLLELGHRDIGLAFPPTADNERARDRMTGVLDALEGAGVTTSDAWRTQAIYNVTLAKQAILDLLDGARMPSALICGNDIIAQATPKPSDTSIRPAIARRSSDATAVSSGNRNDCPAGSF